MEADFTSARSLIKRANFHIDEFESGARAFIQKQPYTEIRDFGPEPGVINFKARINEDIPVDLALDAFEIVNALRSSLDHAVYDAVKMMTGSASPKYTKFPFGKTEAQAAEDLKRKAAEIPENCGSACKKDPVSGVIGV